MHRALVAVVAVLLIAGGVVLSPSPASGSISNLSLVASNNQISATNVTLTISFQVGVAASSLVVTLPTGITGLSTTNTSITKSTDGTSFSAPSLAVSNPKLLSADGKSVAINLLAALASGNWVTVTITGLTNPGTVGGITVTAASKILNIAQVALDALTGLDETLGITYTVVALATNGISSAIGVAPTLGFNAGSSSHSWSLDPSGTASSTSQTETLTVVTNATNYVIQASVAGNLVRAGTDGSSAADRIEYDGASNAPHFSYRVGLPAGDSFPGGQGNSSTVRAWSTSATSLVSGLSLSGLTNSEVTTITYDVLIDYTKAPGSYTGTVTYRVVPTY
jgi:hypothetical protein